MQNLPWDTTKRTVELREIIESGVDIWNHPAMITAGYYPAPSDKPTLFFDSLRKEKLINHYWFRQIGQETVGRFLHMFAAKCSEVVPYYEELYDSVCTMWAIEDPFGNVDVVEKVVEKSDKSATSKGSGSTTENGTQHGTHSIIHKYSDTPQGAIENLDTHLTEAYLDTDTNTGSASNTSRSSSNGESTGKETMERTYTKKGNQGVNTYAHDMTEFRQTIIRIEEDFINEFNELFLGVY